jgi:LPXTG-site transpeptidase (sortase) family protein
MFQVSRPETEKPAAPRKAGRALHLLFAFGVAAVAALAIACGGGGGSKVVVRSSPAATQQPASGGLLTPRPGATAEATVDLTRPTAEPTAQVQPTAVSAADRLMIPQFGVNAPLTLKTVGLDGNMPNPDGPDDIALYNFSSWPGYGGTPGKGGNIVLAGHVDWGAQHGVGCKNNTVKPPCEAVLWNLSDMKVGDQFQVAYGGQTFTYKVQARQSINADDLDTFNKIITATAQETVTIITCTGDFNHGEYNKRFIVTALRV